MGVPVVGVGVGFGDVLPQAPRKNTPKSTPMTAMRFDMGNPPRAGSERGRRSVTVIPLTSHRQPFRCDSASQKRAH